MSYNTSGTVEMDETNDTEFIMESASQHLFVFTVAAFNVLGEGKGSNITSEFMWCITVVLNLYVHRKTANNLGNNQPQ